MKASDLLKHINRINNDGSVTIRVNIKCDKLQVDAVHDIFFSKDYFSVREVFSDRRHITMGRNGAGSQFFYAWKGATLDNRRSKLLRRMCEI